MGPYCDYCDRRCFVPRQLRDGRPTLLATCTGGMAKDFELVGEDHRSAINPKTGRPGYDTREYRELAQQLSRKAIYLSYGTIPDDTTVGEVVDELRRMAVELQRQTPHAEPVAPVAP